MSDILTRELIDEAEGFGTPPIDPPPAIVSESDSRGRRVVTWLRRNLALVASAAVLLVAVGFAVAPSVFASGDPLVGGARPETAGAECRTLVRHRQHRPRRVYRVVHGAGLSLTATLLAVGGIALVAGSLIGLLSGAVGGGALDAVLMRVVDVLLSIPALLLSLALVTALGFGTVNVAIAVGVSLIANFARVMRSEVLRVRRSLYVEAAFASGVRWHTVLRRHVLRNSYPPSWHSPPSSSGWRSSRCRR